MEAVPFLLLGFAFLLATRVRRPNLLLAHLSGSEVSLAPILSLRPGRCTGSSSTGSKPALFFSFSAGPLPICFAGYSFRRPDSGSTSARAQFQFVPPSFWSSQFSVPRKIFIPPAHFPVRLVHRQVCLGLSSALLLRIFLCRRCQVVLLGDFQSHEQERRPSIHSLLGLGGDQAPRSIFRSCGDLSASVVLSCSGFIRSARVLGFPLKLPIYLCCSSIAAELFRSLFPAQASFGISGSRPRDLIHPCMW